MSNSVNYPASMGRASDTQESRETSEDCENAGRREAPSRAGQNPEQRGEAAHLVLILGVHSPGQRLWGLLLGRLDLGLAPSSPWSPQDTHTCFLGPCLARLQGPPP